jgi:hypothetical protein
MAATTLPMTCTEPGCTAPLEGDNPRRTTCSTRCRVRRHRRLQAEKVERERRAIIRRARELLRAQTAAIVSGDVDALDAVTAAASAWLEEVDAA